MKRFVGLVVALLLVCAGCGSDTGVGGITGVTTSAFAGTGGSVAGATTVASSSTSGSAEPGVVSADADVVTSSADVVSASPEPARTTTEATSADPTPTDLALAADLFGISTVVVAPGVTVTANRVAVTASAAADWAAGFGYTSVDATVAGTSIMQTALLNRERQCWIGKDVPGVSGTIHEAGCGPKFMAVFVFP